MAKESFTEEIAAPEGVTVTLDKNVFTVKGEKGEVSRKLFYPKIQNKLEGNKVLLHVPIWTQSEKKILFTYKSHLKNMFKGVKEGITYKLKVCSSHFPMSVAVNNNVLEVKNLFGEKEARTLELKEGVDVKVEGDIITVSGVDKELVGQTAGSAESLTKRKGFDTRVFQDGIYIIEKDGKKV